MGSVPIFSICDFLISSGTRPLDVFLREAIYSQRDQGVSFVLLHISLILREYITIVVRIY